MLGWLRDFYRRNRRKIVMTGVVVGGTYVLGKYISWKMDEWQTMKLEELEIASKKQFHFESTQKTCTTTFISFLPNVRNIIMQKLDTEQLLEILKTKPPNKIEIWNQLKILSLTRVLCSIIANVTLVIMLKVKMNVIGGYMFTVMASNNNDQADDINAMKLKYLNNVRYLIEIKLPYLIDDCRDVVQQSLSKISLKDKLSHGRLKEICIDAIKELKIKLASPNTNKHEFCVYMVDPAWTESEEMNEVYSRIISETVDVLESVDCSLVIDKCLNSGLEQVLDSFKDSFHGYDDAESMETIESCVVQELRSSDLPFAKIIPILNSQIHDIFKAGANGFLDALFSLNLVRELSKNIYDSFTKEFS